jgi:hypothetical protein
VFLRPARKAKAEDSANEAPPPAPTIGRQLSSCEQLARVLAGQGLASKEVYDALRAQGFPAYQAKRAIGWDPTLKPSNQPVEKKLMQTQATVKANGDAGAVPAKICGREGCGKRLNAANRSGYCSDHFADSKRKKGGVPGRVCACGNKLRSDNKTGLCTACQKKPGAAAKRRSTAKHRKPARAAAPVPPPAEERFALHVTVAQLDHYVLGMLEIDWRSAVESMPIDLKLQLANFVLTRQAQELKQLPAESAAA